MHGAHLLTNDLNIVDHELGVEDAHDLVALLPRGQRPVHAPSQDAVTGLDVIHQVVFHH